jgi:predicted regulator of Ras-like GTPase activity (Roadblock/LC7/MglB family)
VDPAPRARDLNGLLTGFASRVPGVLHAVVVAADGVPVAASAGIQPGQLEQLSAITSGLISLARAAAGLSGDDAVSQALVTMKLAVLVIVAIDEGSALAVLTAAAADLDLVAYEMTMLADQAASIVALPARGAAPDTASPA